MDFKYVKDMRGIDKCPPKEASPVEMVAYRYVFETMGDESFLPVAKVTPGRPIPQHQRCVGQSALSMFSCPVKAALKYRATISNHRLFYKRCGTHLAKIKLSHADGIATTPNADGHFSFFEYLTCNLASKCELHEELFSAAV